MKKRIFIVAPNYDGDYLHQVCETLDRDNLINIYQEDRYVVIEGTNSMKDAVEIAKKHGAKRPTII